jgi:hypothetical protein
MTHTYGGVIPGTDEVRIHAMPHWPATLPYPEYHGRFAPLVRRIGLS